MAAVWQSVKLKEIFSSQNVFFFFYKIDYMLLLDRLKSGSVSSTVINVTGMFLLPSLTETQSDQRNATGAT